MNQRGGAAAAHPESGLAQHLLVAAIACAMTVSIAGSGLYFVLRWVEKDREQARIRQFADGLAHRSARELNETVTLLRQRPALAARMLPVVVKKMRRSANSPDQCLGAMRVAAAFAADEPKVVDALFEMRRVGNESLAAEAVTALGALHPPSRAAELLGKCLDDATAPAVVDVVCEQMIQLGVAGRTVMANRLGRLSADRRAWLAGLIEDRRPSQANEWLGLLTADASPAVRARAEEALRQLAAPRTTAAAGTGN